MGGFPLLWGCQPSGVVLVCQVTYLKPGGAPLWGQGILLDGGPMAGLLQVRIPTQDSLVCSHKQKRWHRAKGTCASQNLSTHPGPSQLDHCAPSHPQIVSLGS